MRLAGTGLLLAALTWVLPSSCLATRVADEAALKAAFVANFARFTEWPEAAFDAPAAPLVVGVVGSEPVSRALDELVGELRVHGRELRVRRLRELSESAGCHVLYIASHVSLRAASQDGLVPVLTVGEGEGFLAEGGVIRLVQVERKLGFEVSVDAAHLASLHLSSQVLKLARHVQQTERRP